MILHCICDPASMIVDPDCVFCTDAIDMAVGADKKMKLDLEAERERREAEQKEMEMKQNRQKKIQDKLEALFENVMLVVNHRDGGFTIEFRYRETSFEDLLKISEAFGTKNINLGTEKRNDGFCDTCSYSYTVNLVRVDDIAKEWL